MKLWFVSMECAGIAEAGGVKNVTFSLCKEFSQLGHDVTLFIPVFKCNSWEMLKDIKAEASKQSVELCEKKEEIEYTTAVCVQGMFKVVLVNHPSFAEKEGVYTYTENEEKKNPECKKGEGHKDMLFKDILFQKAVVSYCSCITESDYPDIIHCQDASTAVLPAFVAQKNWKKTPACVVTIHNAGPYYHHEFKTMAEAEWYTGLDEQLMGSCLNEGRVEPFLLAAESGARLTTVSEVYAEELVNPENYSLTDGLAPIFNKKNILIKGITNGFDYDRYNPEDKKISKLPYEFSPEKGDLKGKYQSRRSFVKEIASNDNFNAEGIKKIGYLSCSENCDREIYFAYHGRITTQKGISVLTEAIPVLFSEFSNLRFVIAGQGEPRLENELKQLAHDFPGKVLFLNGYNQSVVRQVTAVCDFIVLPSYFEPCGLEDFIAQAYGTLPVAHKTGGLTKIVNNETGFLYEENTSSVLIKKLREVISLKIEDEAAVNEMIKKAAVSVHAKYYWKNVVKNEYLNFFKEILKK